MESVKVILVNQQDGEVGVMDKMEVHQKGLLHRAFSVFIFNQFGDMLLQQRADEKYHSPGLWSNTCCSHPSPGENSMDAAHRRLKEEMGFTVSLKKIFDFIYRADFENGLIEHEFDHVFVGEYDGIININPAEVKSYVFRSPEEIKKDLIESPAKYTAWFRLAFPKLENYWKLTYNQENV